MISEISVKRARPFRGYSSSNQSEFCGIVNLGGGYNAPHYARALPSAPRGHCGCMLVGELKKGQYVYYHCTGNRGKCPEPYTRQEVLASGFANILQEGLGSCPSRHCEDHGGGRGGCGKVPRRNEKGRQYPKEKACMFILRLQTSAFSEKPIAIQLGRLRSPRIRFCNFFSPDSTILRGGPGWMRTHRRA